MKPASSHRLGLCARARRSLIQLFFGKSTKTTHPSLDRHQSDLRYRALFEQSNDAVFIFDFEGQHLQVNRRAGEMLGYSPKEIVGLSAHDVVVAEEYAQSHDVIQRLLTGESIRPYERTFRHRDGYAIPAEVNVEVIRDNSGNPLYIQSIVRDITERKHMEMALREKLDELDRFFTVALDLLCIADTDGNFIKVNKAWETTLGYPVEELEGRRFLDFVHPDDLPATLNAIAELGKERRILDFANRYKTRSGDYRIIEWISQPYGNLIYAAARDITERKQVEDSLRQSEALYRSMFEENQAIKLLLDPDTGEIIDANTAAVDFYGYTRDQLLSMRIQAINTLTDAEVRAEMELARSEQRKVFNFRHRLANGEVRDVEVFSGPVEVQGNRYLFSIILDVTTRKQAEDALRESEEKHRLIAENTSDGIAVIDGVSNRITYASPTYDRLWGRAVGESINLSAEQHYASIHPDDRDRVYHLIVEAIAQKAETLLLTYRAKHKQGHYFWKEDRVRIVQTPDRSTFQAYVISSDVTGRREMEDALLNSEERLRSILENMLDCVWSIDLIHNRLMYINPAIERVTGWPAEAFFANLQLLVEIVHPDDRSDANFLDVNKDNYSEWTGRIIRPDGEERWLIIRNWLVKDEQGQPVRVEGIASDITERQLAQQREVELTLEREWRLLLETFIQNASHEFRTPLATINSGAYLMARTDDPERRKEKAAQVEEQVKRITRLIDNLILMARVENDNGYGIQSIDIGALVRAACQQATNKCYKQHKLTCDIDSAQMTVEGDSDQLLEAFQQMLHNACRYTPEHGTISVKLWSEARRVWVEIKDSGLGIPEEALIHIFDTLWRQDNAHSTPGLGLGLPIARRIIERHAGKIILTSEVGQGTTLRVALPLVARSEYQSPDTGSGAKER